MTHTIPNKDTFFFLRVATFPLVSKHFHVLGANLCELLLCSQLLLQRDVLLLQGDVLLLQGLQQAGVTLLVLLQGRDGGIQQSDLRRHDWKISATGRGGERERASETVSLRVSLAPFLWTEGGPGGCPALVSAAARSPASAAAGPAPSAETARLCSASYSDSRGRWSAGLAPEHGSATCRRGR